MVVYVHQSSWTDPAVDFRVENDLRASRLDYSGSGPPSVSFPPQTMASGIPLDRRGGGPYQSLTGGKVLPDVVTDDLGRPVVAYGSYTRADHHGPGLPAADEGRVTVNRYLLGAGGSLVVSESSSLVGVHATRVQRRPTLAASQEDSVNLVTVAWMEALPWMDEIDVHHHSLEYPGTGVIVVDLAFPNRVDPNVDEAYPIAFQTADERSLLYTRLVAGPGFNRIGSSNSGLGNPLGEPIQVDTPPFVADSLRCALDVVEEVSPTDPPHLFAFELRSSESADPRWSLEDLLDRQVRLLTGQNILRGRSPRFLRRVVQANEGGRLLGQELADLALGDAQGFGGLLDVVVEAVQDVERLGQERGEVLVSLVAENACPLEMAGPGLARTIRRRMLPMAFEVRSAVLHCEEESQAPNGTLEVLLLAAPFARLADDARRHVLGADEGLHSVAVLAARTRAAGALGLDRFQEFVERQRRGVRRQHGAPPIDRGSPRGPA